MCSLLSSIHENNCFLFFKRYHMNIYPSATQKLPPTLWTISRASIARMSKSPRRGHIACEFWKIEDVAFIFSVYLWHCEPSRMIMATEIVIGQGVQALDELGQWCKARVVDEVGEKWLVSFPSYPGCDRLVGRSEIRERFALNALNEFLEISLFCWKNDCHKKKKAMNYNDLMIFLESMMLWQRKSQLPYCWLSGKLWYLQYHCVGDTICYH